MKIKLFLALGILIVALGGYFCFIIFSSNKVQSFDFSNNEQGPIYSSQLDGQPINTTTVSGVIGIMVDNHPDARPQVGLSEAKVVYEAPVEGDYTRFLAIFSADQQVEKIGPVRSARPYYLQWIKEYGAATYLHCGGSSEALSLIKKENILAANEFYFGRYFWRDESLTTPHNLFTNSEKWQKLLTENSQFNQNKNWSGWKFNKETPVGGEIGVGTKISFSNYYQVSWSYDAPFGRYVRNNSEYFADNVIVQYAQIKIVDEVGRKEIAVVGEGRARMWREGKMWRGIWKKNNLADRTRFYDEQGKEWELKPGQTWVEVVPENATVEISG